MGILLQILGIIALIASLMCSIIAFTNGGSKVCALVLLAIGSSLVKIGRDIYNCKRKP